VFRPVLQRNVLADGLGDRLQRYAAKLGQRAAHLAGQAEALGGQGIERIIEGERGDVFHTEKRGERLALGGAGLDPARAGRAGVVCPDDSREGQGAALAPWRLRRHCGFR
jgi:hypothetical protein